MYDRSIQEKALTTEIMKMEVENLNDIGQKQVIALKLNQEAAANRQLWDAFVQIYP